MSIEKNVRREIIPSRQLIPEPGVEDLFISSRLSSRVIQN
jgi:hypothetical protein